MKSKNFAGICTGTSTTSRRRAGTRSVLESRGPACEGHFNHEMVAPVFPEATPLKRAGKTEEQLPCCQPGWH